MVSRKPSKRSKQSARGDAVVLLSGGNPQIPKGDGDGPVQAYIAAMPEEPAPMMQTLAKSRRAYQAWLAGQFGGPTRT